jgi:hypothetical protein
MWQSQFSFLLVFAVLCAYGTYLLLRHKMGGGCIERSVFVNRVNREEKSVVPRHTNKEKRKRRHNKTEKQ